MGILVFRNIEPLPVVDHMEHIDPLRLPAAIKIKLGQVGRDLVIALREEQIF